MSNILPKPVLLYKEDMLSVRRLPGWLSLTVYKALSSDGSAPAWPRSHGQLILGIFPSNCTMCTQHCENNAIMASQMHFVPLTTCKMNAMNIEYQVRIHLSIQGSCKTCQQQLEIESVQFYITFIITLLSIVR